MDKMTAARMLIDMYETCAKTPFIHYPIGSLVGMLQSHAGLLPTGYLLPDTINAAYEIITNHNQKPHNK